MTRLGFLISTVFIKIFGTGKMYDCSQVGPCIKSPSIVINNNSAYPLEATYRGKRFIVDKWRTAEID